MKKSFVRYLALPLMVSAAFLTACGSSVSSDDDDDDSTESEEVSSSDAKKGSSSSSKGSSKSSSSAADTTTYVKTDDLSIPTDFMSVRLAPSIWMLNWAISSSGDEGDGFIIQRLSPGGDAWEDFEKVGTGVTHKLLDGESFSNYYYRVAVYSNKSRSAYSSEAFVSTQTAYEENLTLATPTVTANIDQDSVLELFLSNYAPSISMVNSPYNLNSKGKMTGEVFFQVRFVYGSDNNADTLKYAADQASFSKKFKSISSWCNSYAQVRLAWKDKNGVSDYSEWSTPIGTKAGTSEGLGNSNNKCSVTEATGDDEKSPFNAPTEIAAVEQSDGSWMIQWNYVPSEMRPGTGFILQKLNLKKSEWVDFDSTGADVYRILLPKVTEAYSYYRVAAYDKNGRSAFTNDVLVAVEEGTAVAAGGLSTPANLAITRVAPSVWELKWESEIANDDPANHYVIQGSKLKDFAWENVGEAASNNRVFYISGLDKKETYYRMAMTDGHDTSVFTEAIQLTPNLPYREDMDPVTPEMTAYFTHYYTTAYETDGDTSTVDSTDVDATIEYSANVGFINLNIYQSEYTDTVYYEARWFTSTEYYNPKDREDDAGKKKYGKTWTEAFGYDEPAIKFGFYAYDVVDGMSIESTYEKKYGYDYDKHVQLYYDSGLDEVERQSIMTNEAITASAINSYARNLCDYFIQVRVVWKDVNGAVDYSEWTAPSSVRDVAAAKTFCHVE